MSKRASGLTVTCHKNPNLLGNKFYKIRDLFKKMIRCKQLICDPITRYNSTVAVRKVAATPAPEFPPHLLFSITVDSRNILLALLSSYDRLPQVGRVRIYKTLDVSSKQAKSPKTRTHCIKYPHIAHYTCINLSRINNTGTKSAIRAVINCV